MSEVRNGERPTYAFSDPPEGRRDPVNRRPKPGYHVAEGGELLASEGDDALAVDEELVADLERTVRQTIRSAQEVAHSLVARARKREALARAKTDERCTLLVAHAEREATVILQRAAAEAVEKLKDAENGIAEMLAAAHRRRDTVFAELERQSMALEEKIARLRQEHDRLARALDVLEGTVRQGREALDDESEWAATRPFSDGVGQNPRNGAASPTVRGYAGGGAALPPAPQ